MAKLVGVDKWLFFTTCLLVLVGLIMVFSASAVMAQERYHSAYGFVIKQTIWALLGLAAMVVLMQVDAKLYNSPKFAYVSVAMVLCMLASVFAFSKVHNTYRWIHFGSFFSFQPSELAKPVLILFLAWFLHNRLDRINDFRRVLAPALIVPGLFILLIVKQPDLGTALVLAGVTGLLLLLAGLYWRYLIGCVLVCLPYLIYLLSVPWRRKRLLVFLYPELAPLKEGYHVAQSLIAVGSGGLYGRGFMEGQQKLFFLPEAHTDFIFANVAEELGFAGAIAILILFVVFAVRGFRAARRTREPFFRLAAFGITAVIVLQAFFNISVVLAMLPAKGIPLPLISYGGTSVFFSLASIGILLNITRKAEGG